jgi:hypothetical protein
LRCARPSYAENASSLIGDGCFELGNAEREFSKTAPTKASKGGMAAGFRADSGARDARERAPITSKIKYTY